MIGGGELQKECAELIQELNLQDSVTLAGVKTPSYYPGTVIQDENQSIGRAFDAKVTPHCFVIDGKGVLVYKGAIDSISSAKSADIEKANNYVLAAVKAVKEGKAPEVTSTKPYGCGVKYSKL